MTTKLGSSYEDEAYPLNYRIFYPFSIPFLARPLKAVDSVKRPPKKIGTLSDHT